MRRKSENSEIWLLKCWRIADRTEQRIQYARASHTRSKPYHKKHHPRTAFSYPSPSLSHLFPFLSPFFQSHVDQNTSGKSSRSCSLVLERTTEKGVLWRGLVTRRTPLSQINFGIQGGDKRPSTRGLIVSVYAQLSWLFHPAFALCLPNVSPVLQNLLKSFL